MAAAAQTVGAAGSSGAQWQFLQCFGERSPGEDIQEADIISAVEFDHDGCHLATGDRGGRVVLFEKVTPQQKYPGLDARAPPPFRGPGFEYRYLTEFQSHEPEFDYLKSLEIEEKVNKVAWCRSSSSSRMLLSTNDKTIKLWRVYEKKVLALTNFNVAPRGGSPPGGFPGSPGGPRGMSPAAAAAAAAAALPLPRLTGPLRLPTVASADSMLASRCKRVYGNAHTYHINSISVNTDQETFLSADDLRINLWSLEVAATSFNIVDIKPPNMEDLTEVITSAKFHPSHCHILAYSSSKGCVRLADMRSRALCDGHAKAFEDADHAANKSFFSEIIASISDIAFGRDGRHLLSRDYMSLKLWDVNMEGRPLATYPVHEPLRGKLCELYESDCIFDKFDCCMSRSGDMVATGTYNNSFKVFGVPGGGETSLEATRDPLRKRAATPNKGARFGIRKTPLNGKPAPVADADGTGLDLSMKLLHLAWHPEANVLACAASNSLYMICNS